MSSGKCFSACSRDVDCTSGYGCVAKRCQPAECTRNTDCNIGESCKQSKCVAQPITPEPPITECSSNFDCAIDEECILGSCEVKQAECAFNEDCPIDSICEFGTCTIAPETTGTPSGPTGGTGGVPNYAVQSIAKPTITGTTAKTKISVSLPANPAATVAVLCTLSNEENIIDEKTINIQSSPSSVASVKSISCDFDATDVRDMLKKTSTTDVIIDAMVDPLEVINESSESDNSKTLETTLTSTQFGICVISGDCTTTNAVCANNTCVSCTETDTNGDVTKKGTTTGVSQTNNATVSLTDSCGTDGKLTEYTCYTSGPYKGYVTSETKPCESGKECTAGACVEVTMPLALCDEADCDGFGCNQTTDACYLECTDNTQCSGDNICNSHHGCTALSPCTDNDGGLGVTKKGVTNGSWFNSGLNTSKTDACSGRKVIEYSCPTTGQYAGYVYEEILACPAGQACKDGACAAAPEPACNDGQDNENDGFVDFIGAGTQTDLTSIVAIGLQTRLIRQ